MKGKNKIQKLIYVNSYVLAKDKITEEMQKKMLMWGNA